MPAGRPPMPFTEEIADVILEGISEGKGLVTVLKENDALPSYSTVMKWVRQNPEFAQNYARACEDMADHDADKIADVAQRVIRGEVDPQAARVAIDAYKWSAGKRRPKKYGDKIELEQSGSVSVTHVVDVSGLSMDELNVLEKVFTGD